MKIIFAILSFFLLTADSCNFNFKRLNKFEHAKTIINQQFGYGTLSTLSNYKKIHNYPQNSIVAYSCTNKGEPIFCFSSISMHSRNIRANNSISLSITEKNFKNAADARVTFVGNLQKIDDKILEIKLKSKFLESHPDAFWAGFDDFSIYLLNDIKDLSINGGFAKADKLNLETYFSASPDVIALKTNEILDDFNFTLKKYYEKYLKLKTKITLKNIDRYGINLRTYENNKSSLYKILFDKEVFTLNDLNEELIKIIK